MRKTLALVSSTALMAARDASLDIDAQLGRTAEARLRYAVPGIVDPSARAFGEQIIKLDAAGP